jgi:hypothetical protein
VTSKLIQARIVHLSDLHFGKGHRFAAKQSPSGPPGSNRGIPTLAVSVTRDLQSLTGNIWQSDSTESPNPLLFAITGDLTQTGSDVELEMAANKALFVRASTWLNSGQNGAGVEGAGARA